MSQYIKGRLFINHVENQGFSESYHFATTSYADAKTWFGSILNYRSLLLGLNCRIEWASLSLSNSERDSEVPVGYLASPAELDTEVGLGAEKIDRLSAGLKVRFFTGTGLASTMLFRGIRDSWCDDQALTVTPAAAVSYAALVPAAAGFTAAYAIMAYAVTVRTLTCHVKKIGVNDYTLTPWTAFNYKGIGERDCGKGYSYGSGRKRATV